MNLNTRDGWSTTNGIGTTSSVSVTIEALDAYSMGSDDITRALSYKMADVIFSKGLVSVDSSRDEYARKIIYRASMNVSDTPNKFFNRIDDSFVVNGESFTNEELIEAVKNTYPERLI